MRSKLQSLSMASSSQAEGILILCYSMKSRCSKLGDVTPERDTIELELVNRMLAADKPILGICRGHQVINVALGGTTLPGHRLAKCRAAIAAQSKSKA